MSKSIFAWCARYDMAYLQALDRLLMVQEWQRVDRDDEVLIREGEAPWHASTPLSGQNACRADPACHADRVRR
jgi:hypothetical protein